jgi:hypothetical protein
MTFTTILGRLHPDRFEGRFTIALAGPKTERPLLSGGRLHLPVLLAAAQ